MTDITELTAKLKAAALKATALNLDTAQVKRGNGGYLECPCCEGAGYVEEENDFCNIDGVALGVQFYGIGPHHGLAEEYLREANPTNILALTEALEAAQSRIAEFKARAEAAEKRYENRTPTEWAYGQACAAIENHRARADAAEARISELEARTLTVKLPRRRTYEDYADARFSNADLAAIHNVTVSSMIRIFEENCAAAGISLKIEGE